MLVQKKGTGISGLTSKRYKRYFRKCRHRQNSKLVRHIDFYPTRDSVKETDIDTNLTTTNLEKSVSSVNSLIPYIDIGQNVWSSVTSQDTF